MIAIIELICLVLFFTLVVPFACDQKPICVTIDSKEHCIRLNNGQPKPAEK